MLILSLLASIAVWTILYSWKFALVIIGSIFIHEYGHFYWMGREGIKKKDMFFIPPFGAVARANELWSSRGAESRIALAGPAFGLISIAIFTVLWLSSHSPIFAASIVIASYINLFNLLLPVAILDGGRVIKSILFSIHDGLGKSFYRFGFILLAIAFLFFKLSPLFIFLVGYFLWSEYSSLLRAEGALSKANMVLGRIQEMRNTPNFPSQEFADSIDELTATTHGYSSVAVLRKHKNELEQFINLPAMNKREMGLSILTFITIASIYILAILIIKNTINLDFSTLPSYFK